MALDSKNEPQVTTLGGGLLLSSAARRRPVPAPTAPACPPGVATYALTAAAHLTAADHITSSALNRGAANDVPDHRAHSRSIRNELWASRPGRHTSTHRP